MNKEFLPRNESLELKALGFDEPCFVVWPGIEGQKLGYDGKYFSLVKGYKNSKLSKEVKRYAPGIIDVAAPTFSQAINFLYICSNKQIDIELKASDTYEERVRKVAQGCEDLRNLQNNKFN